MLPRSHPTALRKTTMSPRHTFVQIAAMDARLEVGFRFFLGYGLFSGASTAPPGHPAPRPARTNLA